MVTKKRDKPANFSLEDAIDEAVNSGEEIEPAMSTAEEIIPDPTISSVEDIPLPISNADNKIEILEQQIKGLIAHNNQMAQAIKATADQGNQILTVVQQMIVPDKNKGEVSNQPQQINAGVLPEQSGGSGGPAWVEILKHGKDILGNFAYILQEARQAGTPITNESAIDGLSDIKAIGSVLKVFGEFNKINTQMRTWAKEQVIADPVAQLELLNNKNFQQMLFQQLSNAQQQSKALPQSQVDVPAAEHYPL